MDKEKFRTDKNEKLLALVNKKSSGTVNYFASSAALAKNNQTIMGKPIIENTVPRDGQALVYDEENGWWYADTVSASGASGASNFIDLNDVPASYAGASGKYVAVKADESGLEFVDASMGGGVDNFLDLTDTPNDYTSQRGKLVAVNGAENALEFIDPPAESVLLDQTTPQTVTSGNVTVDDPSDPGHIANKRYVDEQIANLHVDYYLDDAADALGGLYLEMRDSLIATGTVTSAAMTAGTTNWKNWITPSGEPGLTEIIKGNFELHIHASASSVTGVTTSLYFELYTRAVDTTETLRGTSSSTGNLTTSNAPYEVYIHIASDIAITATDRWVLKCYAVCTGVPNRTVSVYIGTPANNSHISVDVPSTILGNFEEVANKEVGSTLTDSVTKYPSSATMIDVLSALKLDDLAAPDNNTDLNVSTTAHGLCPVLPNDANKYLNGLGNWVGLALYVLYFLLNVTSPISSSTDEQELNTNFLSNLTSPITSA